MDRYIEFATNHWMLFVALIAITFFLIQDIIESALQKFEALSPSLAVAKMNQEDAIVIDIREEHEYRKGHIVDTINLPLSKFDENIKKISKHKNSPVIVVCQTGTRSITACKKLVKEGFEKVYNITGGMQSWEDNKLPIKVSKK